MALIFGLFIESIIIDYIDGTQLTFLFCIIFGGAFIVTFNIKVLGGKISYLQSVSVLGYCIAPIFVVAMIIQLMKLLDYKSNTIKFILVCIACIWCLFCNHLLLY